MDLHKKSYGMFQTRELRRAQRKTKLSAVHRETLPRKSTSRDNGLRLGLLFLFDLRRSVFLFFT